MSSSTLSLSGIFPPIVTPFDLNGCIDFDCLQTNMIKWNEFTFKGKSCNDIVYLLQLIRLSCEVVSYDAIAIFAFFIKQLKYNDTLYV